MSNSETAALAEVLFHHRKQQVEAKRRFRLATRAYEQTKARVYLEKFGQDKKHNHASAKVTLDTDVIAAKAAMDEAEFKYDYARYVSERVENVIALSTPRSSRKGFKVVKAAA